MAAAVGRFYKSRLLQPRNSNYLQQAVNLSTSSWTKGRKNLVATIGALAGGAGALIYALDVSVKASDLAAHPPKLPWAHCGFINSYDHASIRRGYEVYKQVCSACHSMKYMFYRRLVDVCYTESDAKKEAEEIQVEDGPDDAGNYYMRPGKLSDRFPSPYPNEEAARAANNGAYPPDLSFISSARHGKENYLFHLLTGYFDAPAGHIVGEGQYYNVYFPGGNISMAKALYDDVIEYDDGTPATTSQLAKDVSAFLRWSSEPEFDVRRLYFIKLCLWGPVLLFISLYWKRFKWSTLKTQKIVIHPPAKRLK
ncbi:hypothetical protein RUM43_013403 [Polyplax serrata]|uniref:Cytochrome c domain-containing protein n=1 Tax=Polyplax serrata TaxID=468196 RepID=A0AAN8Q2R6_POLSC